MASFILPILPKARAQPPNTRFEVTQLPYRRQRSTATTRTAESKADLMHYARMSTAEQQTPPIEERIGSMVGKIIVLALCALLLWGYSTTFLAQIGLF
jgi:hypothetical protein